MEKITLKLTLPLTTIKWLRGQLKDAPDLVAQINEQLPPEEVVLVKCPHCPHPGFPSRIATEKHLEEVENYDNNFDNQDDSAWAESYRLWAGKGV